MLISKNTNTNFFTVNRTANTSEGGVFDDLYDVIWKNMSYWDIVNNSTIFKEESIPFIQKEILPYIVSFATKYTGDTRFYFFVDVSSVVKKYINPNFDDFFIPITEELIEKYDVSVKEYVENHSIKNLISLLIVELAENQIRFSAERIPNKEL